MQQHKFNNTKFRSCSNKKYSKTPMQFLDLIKDRETKKKEPT